MAERPDGSRYLLVFNAGSSSLKFGIFELAESIQSSLRGAVRDIGRSRSSLTLDDGNGSEEDLGNIGSVTDAAAIVLDRMADGMGGARLTQDNVVATGHRVVHGGEHFAAPAVIDAPAFEKLQSLTHLAPLHNPHSLEVIQAVRERFPQIPVAAEFDTSFFHDLPDVACRYAIPQEWSTRYSIRRYGFHGIAHRYMSEQLGRASQTDNTPGRVVSLHLGQGCSVTALRDGRPVETSMGFTPLEGLIMGTRSGDIDAGLVLYLARQGHGWEELEDVLNRNSGLLGLSGESDDVRKLLELESQQHAGARLALAAFCHRITKYLGAYAAVLGGIDSIVIGGGIGENSPVVRARICAGLGWLGLKLDAEANARCVGAAACISTGDSAIDVRVIPVDEEEIIANATRLALRDEDAG